MRRCLIMAVLVIGGVVSQQERDLKYGPHELQTLDLAVPRVSGFPTVLFVHGGGLTGGDKADADYRSFCAPFAAHEIGCASINYRLCPGHPLPPHTHVWPAALSRL